MKFSIIRHLLAPDSPAGLPTLPEPPKPAAAPAPKPAAPSAPAAPSKTPPPAPAGAPAADPVVEDNDDPFWNPGAPKPEPAAAPAAPVAAPAAAPAVTDFDKLAPKELRERVKALNQEKGTLGEQIQKLQAQIKQLEGRGADTSALTTTLEGVKKERDAALAELRAARQEASPEFREKFDKPFNQAAEDLKSQITTLTVTDEEGNTRPATWEDFSTLYGLPIGKAIEQINKMFGTQAGFVIGELRSLQKMDRARQIALQEEKSQFKERSDREIADQAVKRESVGRQWQETNKKLADTVPDYKVDATDAEASEAHKHALSVFDEPVKVTDDASMSKKILKDAHIRQRVGAYAVQKVLLARKDATIASLQKQIEELKGAAPGGTQRPGGDAPPAEGENEESWGEGLKKAARG